MGTIIRDNGNGTCLVVDIATLEDINLVNKEFDPILKYKNLTIEVGPVWN